MSDIPDEYRRDRSDGENMGRLASGVQTELGSAQEAAGAAIGARLVHASFHFRSGEIGREMWRAAHTSTESLKETPQLIQFAGCSLSATSLASTIDLLAAAVSRMHGIVVRPSDPEQEADLEWFFQKRNEAALDALTPPFRRWIGETREDKEWEVLKGVRDHFVHRPFRIDITITLGGGPITQELVVAGQRHSMSEFLEDCRAFVVDRFVACCLLFRAQAISDDVG